MNKQNPPPELVVQARNEHNLGIAIFAIAGCFLFIAIVLLIFLNTTLAILITLFNLWVGYYGIHKLNQSSQTPLPIPMRATTENFELPVSEKQVITILFEFRYPERDYSQNLEKRLRFSIMPVVNRFIMKFVSVHKAPFSPSELTPEHYRELEEEADKAFDQDFQDLHLAVGPITRVIIMSIGSANAAHKLPEDGDLILGSTL